MILDKIHGQRVTPRRRRAAGRTLFPQPAVQEYLLDLPAAPAASQAGHLGLPSLDESDDLHLGTTHLGQHSQFDSLDAASLLGPAGHNGHPRGGRLRHETARATGSGTASPERSPARQSAGFVRRSRCLQLTTNDMAKCCRSVFCAGSINVHQMPDHVGFAHVLVVLLPRARL